MTCARCRGMMIADRLLDDMGRAAFFMWRCVHCGEIVDPVILSNRGRRPEGGKRRFSKLIVWVKPEK